MNELTSGADTLATIDKYLKLINEDVSVDSCWADGKNVIHIEYKNKMSGGIIIENFETAQGDLEFINTPVKEEGDRTLGIPLSRKALYWDAHYIERVKYTEKMIKWVADSLEKVGILLDVYKEVQTDFEKMKTLDDYGLVHFYSHGMPYPEKFNIKRVYLLSGTEYLQKDVDKLIEEYKDDIKSHDIRLYTRTAGGEGSGGPQITEFVVSPEFIGKYNDFSKNNTIFYGAFCFSGLGDWQKITKEYGASVYIGYTWSVDTKWSCTWAYDLYRYLSRIEDEHPPYNVDDWETGPCHESIDKYYRTAECSMIFPAATGDKSTTLWEEPEVRVVKTFGSPAFDDFKIKINPVALFGKDYKVKGQWASDVKTYPNAQYSIIAGFIEDDAKFFDLGIFDVKIHEQKEFSRFIDISFNIPKQAKEYKYFKIQLTSRGNNEDNPSKADYFETRIFKIMIFPTD
jgi:hypothetical protein